MRVALLLALLVSVGSGLTTGCSRSACATAEAAQPVPVVHFAATLGSGTVSNVVLLTTTPLALDAGMPIPGMVPQTVAAIRTYAGGSMAAAWLDQRSRWHDSLGRDMHGSGIGNAPVIPPAPSGPFVTIGGRTSVAHFPLEMQTRYDANDDAGVPGDAGRREAGTDRRTACGACRRARPA